jgi:hypothetical protein
MELLLCGLGILICLVPVLFAAVLLPASLLKAEAGAFGGALLILGLFGTLIFLAGKMMFRAWRGLGVRLLVYSEGIVYTRWLRVITYRWEDILAFSYWTIDQVDRDKHYPSIVHYLNSIYYYRFRHSDGHRFIFSEKLDRHAEKPIAHFVEKGLLDAQLPLLRERLLQQSEEIPFGPFTVGLEGLAYKRTLLPWPEVDFIWSEDGKVQVRKKDKVLNWCSVKMDRVPNCCLFLALAKERACAREALRMKVLAAKCVDLVEEEIVGGFGAKFLGFKLFGFRWKFVLALLMIYLLGYFIVLAWWSGSMDFNEMVLYTLAVPFVVLVRVLVTLIWLWRGERLILGKDYLQRATKKGEVLAQIPYKNIARIEFVSEPGKETYIGIDLKDLNDPATFHAGVESAKSDPGWYYPQALHQFLLRFIGDESAKNNSGWHYRIANEWSMPLQQMHERLQKRLPF